MKVEHRGYTFEAKGNEVLVGKENFVLDGDVLKMESRRDGNLWVSTERAVYIINGPTPEAMVAHYLDRRAA